MKKKELPLLNQKRKGNIKSFWRQDGMDWMAHLGDFERAIVVTYFTPKFPSTDGGYYAIGKRSFFPFTNEQHDTKFNNHFDCIEYAESILLKFVQSLFIQERFSNTQPLPHGAGNTLKQAPTPEGRTKITHRLG